MAGGRCLIGTSGWSYRHWRGGAFYPKGLRQADELGFYAERLASVEVNGTFYRLIAADTFRKWCEQTPAGFVFACKGSRFLTHMKRLKDSGQGLVRYFERVEALEKRLGPVVFQLPDRFKPDLERLAGFLDALPAHHRYAFEFRDAAWFVPAVLSLLAARNVALCLYEFAGREAPFEVTADFVYIRLHGPDGAYQGSYDDAALERWAGRIHDWTRRGRDVYCYFDNDQNAYAPENALRLQALMAPARSG
jgi:uncharacterized protein YecE (DUF72 family)